MGYSPLRRISERKKHYPTATSSGSHSTFNIVNHQLTHHFGPIFISSWAIFFSTNSPDNPIPVRLLQYLHSSTQLSKRQSCSSHHEEPSTIWSSITALQPLCKNNQVLAVNKTSDANHTTKTNPSNIYHLPSRPVQYTILTIVTHPLSCT